MSYLFLLFTFFCSTESYSGKCSESISIESACKQIDIKPTPQIAEGTTFIIVRHAEKQKEGKDPELNEDGKARADELAFCLGKLDIAAIYSTPYNRTRQTVKPLAEKLKLPVTEYEATMPYDQLINQISETNPGKVIVIAGHSNTVPEMLKVLSNGSYVVSIPETEYDNLFIVTTAKKSEPHVMTLKYGKKLHE